MAVIHEARGGHLRKRVKAGAGYPISAIPNKYEQERESAGGGRHTYKAQHKLELAGIAGRPRRNTMRMTFASMAVLVLMGASAAYAGGGGSGGSGTGGVPQASQQDEQPASTHKHKPHKSE
jgi:hypothetical protein